MSNINPTFNDRVRYELSSTKVSYTLVIDEPIGWQSDDKEFARNEEYHGIFTKFSNSLKFVGTGADYINTARDLYGINCDLRLTKFEKHPVTDKWVKTYWGYLDLSTWEFSSEQVSVKFNSGGLEQIIKARESENVEIDRPDTMDGKPLAPIRTDQVAFDGRRIFLKSSWEANNDSSPVRIRVHSDDGNTRYAGCAYPLTLVNRSHEEAQSSLANVSGPGDTGSTGRMIMTLFDRPRTIRCYANNLKFTPAVYPKNVGWAFLKVCVTTYKNGLDYDLKERRVIFHAGHLSPGQPNVFAISGQTFSLNFDETFAVDEGDSLAIEFYIGADLGPSEDFLADISQFDGNAYVEEDSYFEPSQSKFILIHEFLDRLTSICANGTGLFYSEYFGRTDLGYTVDGAGAYLGLTHGFWIRGFDKLPLSDLNKFKSLSTNLKDAVESVGVVQNVGMGIEEYRNRERLRIEPLSYFYNNNITIVLPNQVKNVKRSIATKYYPSAIEIGYDKGGDYAEAQGLDEPNGKTNFVTVITRVKELLSKISTYRADSYGKEFARRKPESRDNTLDTQYDEDIWFLDLKKGVTSVFLERKWQDDFAQAPTGIFSPDTANNLRLSPVNLLFRHGWVIAAALKAYPTDYIKYGSSTANSKLKTKLIGRNEYSENGDILNSELQTARFVPEWIEFEHECNFGIMQQVQGKTIIQGQEIPNFYGTVKFLNERNEWEKGFLFNLKPNGKGVWKVLKSNR